MGRGGKEGRGGEGKRDAGRGTRGDSAVFVCFAVQRVRVTRREGDEGVMDKGVMDEGVMDEGVMEPRKPKSWRVGKRVSRVPVCERRQSSRLWGQRGQEASQQKKRKSVSQLGKRENCSIQDSRVVPHRSTS